MILEADVRAISRASFAFGDIPLEFESTDGVWLSYLDQRYGRFAIERGSDSFFVRFESTSAPLPAGLETRLAAHLEAVDCKPTARGYQVSTATTDCDIDLFSRRAILRGPSAMYPLDNVLRHLLPLLMKDGLIVHSALVEGGQRGGVLACGPSGAGKSTLAQLARGRALSDELAAVSLDGGVSAIALPFWNSRCGRAPLRAVLHLAHAPSHRLERLRPETAMRRIASQVLWPVWDEPAMARAFGYLAQIAETVPAFDLAFAPTDDVWDFIDKEIR